MQRRALPRLVTEAHPWYICELNFESQEQLLQHWREGHSLRAFTRCPACHSDLDYFSCGAHLCRILRRHGPWAIAYPGRYEMLLCALSQVQDHRVDTAMEILRELGQGFCTNSGSSSF